MDVTLLTLQWSCSRMVLIGTLGQKASALIQEFPVSYILAAYSWIVENDLKFQAIVLFILTLLDHTMRSLSSFFLLFRLETRVHIS